MKLGYLTAFSREEARLASSIGFDGIETHARSWSPDQITSKAKLAEVAQETKDILCQTSLTITAVASYDVTILCKPVKTAVSGFRKVIDLTAALGVDVITAMAGRIPDKPAEESIPQFKKVYGEIARIAAGAGVRIAFENWPGFYGYPLMGRNLAYCPAYWDMMFNAVPSKALGLEYDPSHLYWLGIDYIETAKKYAKRIYHVHAKDTEILPGPRQERGILEGRWWRYRIPGFGEVNWHKFISTLYEGGFNGGIAIEHEDGVFSGDKRAEGLRLGYNFLKPILPR